jgi:transposase
MEDIIECCAGTDVHKEILVVCTLTGPLNRKPQKELREFSASTAGLLELATWLEELAITHVAMESTGIYWKPLWNLLASSDCDFNLMLANARNVKNVPGHKTDRCDATWIARLCRAGLIESSFVPPRDIEELRELTRYRKRLIRDTTAEKNRIHKTLRRNNVGIDSCMADIFCVSGIALLEALIDGEVITADKLDLIIKGRTRSKIPQLLDALNIGLSTHARQMIQYSYKHLLYAEQLIMEVEQDIDNHLVPYSEQKALLDTIPGIDKHAAAILIAELGVDMSVFPSAKHCASWAGICPGNKESAGKKGRTKAIHGNKALRAILCESAWASSRCRQTRISSRYWRLVKRMGEKKAILAIGHLLLVISYNALKDLKPYNELGADYFTQKPPHINLMIKKLLRAGYAVIPPEIQETNAETGPA